MWQVVICIDLICLFHSYIKNIQMSGKRSDSGQGWWEWIINCMHGKWTMVETAACIVKSENLSHFMTETGILIIAVQTWLCDVNTWELLQILSAICYSAQHWGGGGGGFSFHNFSVCTCSAPLSCAVCFVFVYRYVNYIYSAPSPTQAFESFLNNVIWSLNFEQLKYFSSHSYV